MIERETSNWPNAGGPSGRSTAASPEPHTSSSAWRRWRRRGLVAIGWLGLGAVMSVAVAWGCIVGRVYVGVWVMGSLVGGNAGVTMKGCSWPIEMEELAGPPQSVSTLTATGYRRSVAQGLLAPDPEGKWVDWTDMRPSRNDSAISREIRESLASVPPHDSQALREAIAQHRVARAREIEEESKRFREYVNSCASWTQFQRQSGWPWLCMESRYVEKRMAAAGRGEYVVGGDLQSAPAGAMTWRQLIDRGIRWPQAWSTPTGTAFTLPLRPVWPGLLMSSVAWATVMWGLSRGVGAWRRRRRLGEGQCVKCRYQVDELAICPECGAANWGGR